MNFHFVSFEFNPYTLESSKRTYNHARIWSQLLGQNVEFDFLHVGQHLVGILGINVSTREQDYVVHEFWMLTLICLEFNHFIPMLRAITFPYIL